MFALGLLSILSGVLIMGKKKIQSQSETELLKETDKLESVQKKVANSTAVQPQKSKWMDKGRIYIQSTYNNTLITLTDENGNVVLWASSGSVGFKGTKKSTPFAASKAAEIIADKAKMMGINKADVVVKGVGAGRESAIRTFSSKGIETGLIRDVTPIPHGGVKPRKARRV